MVLRVKSINVGYQIRGESYNLMHYGGDVEHVNMYPGGGEKKVMKKNKRSLPVVENNGARLKLDL